VAADTIDEDETLGVTDIRLPRLGSSKGRSADAHLCCWSGDSSGTGLDSSIPGSSSGAWSSVT